MKSGVIDVWMQHPTLRHANQEMFDSLHRWMGVSTFASVLPLELTIAAMDEAGVRLGLAQLDQLGLDETRTLFLTDNARRVFGL